MTQLMDLGGSPRRAAANVARAARLGVARGMFGRGSAWLRLRLASPVPELAAPAWFGQREPQLSLLDVLRVLDVAKDDPDVAGVAIRLLGPSGGASRVESLRRAIGAMRQAGKPVVVWSESLTTQELWLASAASQVVIPPSGSVHLLGFRFEGFFLRDLLQRLGVRADVMRVGDFKSAGEILTRSGYSEEARAQLETLADDLFDTLVRDVASGRGLSEAQVRGHVDRGLLTASRAREAGLVDACLYPDELDHLLCELAPTACKEDKPRLLDASAYCGLRASDAGFRPFLQQSSKLVYVAARGGISRGRGFRGIAADTYRRFLEPLAERDDVLGVVLRVDSPGGEGVASDLLCRAVARIAKEKPIVVSMGDTAASGGYFLAASATAILAEATTITGSIGVVGGKLDFSELYERVGVGRDAVERGAQAGLHSEARSFTQSERRALRDELGALYELFLERVAEGRGRSRDEIHAVAQGRVWSGAGAARHGLVDSLGGPLEALREVRDRAGLGAGERLVLEEHPRLPRLGGLWEMLGR
ncbi:MAG: hypothetical protein GY937_03445 [bacterium]|nr:hypothetical protein [bacterium]